MATDLVDLLSRLSLPAAPLPSYLDQNFTENAVRRAPQAVAFVPPPVVPIPQPATFFIGFGGAWEDACGFAASATVTGDDGSFCNCNTFTGAIFAAASTGTWYISDGSQYVSVSITNGNPVATVTSACSACVTTTTTSTTTTTTTLDCAQTGSVFPTSSLDCVLTGSVIIVDPPPPTTTTTTTTSTTTTTTTTLCPIECALTGSAIPSINDECGLTGSVYPIYIPPPPPTTTTSTTTTTTTVPPTTTTSTTTSTTTVTPTTTTSTTTSTTTAPPPTTTTSTTTSTTTALSVWYQLTNCADSSIGYSQEYPFGTFAINDRVTSPGITWVVTGTQLVDPGGTLYAITATGFIQCPTTTTTSTTTSTTTAEPTTTTSTTTSTTTAEPTTTTSTTTSTTTAEPTTTTSTTTSTTTVTPTTTTSTTTSTTTAPIYSYGLGVDSVSGANACANFTIDPIVYFSAAAALADGVVLYQDGALSTVAPNNYYSDGISNWLITGGNGILTNETSCPI